MLNESIKNFSQFHGVQKLKASENYLKDYADKNFDICLSLQVLHHIQPKINAIDAFEQMLRVSKKAVVIMDFEQQKTFTKFIRFLNFLLGFSKELSEDGVKSMLRAYPIDELLPDFKQLCDKYGYELKIHKFLTHPYWHLAAIKKSLK